MKPQVLTIRISASLGSAVGTKPPEASVPMIFSESTRFFGQPSEMIPTVGPVAVSVSI